LPAKLESATPRERRTFFFLTTRFFAERFGFAAGDGKIADFPAALTGARLNQRKLRT